LQLDAYGAEKQEWLPPKSEPAKKLFGRSKKLILGNNAEE
jgi:hypothetical protein